SNPPAACRTRRAPVHMRLTATSAAIAGSIQGFPVTRSSTRPITMPTLVQKSESTCWPSATSVSDRWRRPVRTRNRPSSRLTRPAPQQVAAPRLELADLHAPDQRLHDLVEDDHRGERDEPALEGRGHEFDLPVPVWVVPVRRPPREHEAAQREESGDDVDD